MSTPAEFFAELDMQADEAAAAEAAAQAPEPTPEPVAAEATATPAPVAEAAPAPSQEAERTVPLATLIEERKRLQAEILEERARNQRFEKLQDEIRALKEAKAAPAPEPTPEPDYLEDPKGYTDAKINAAVEKLTKVEQQATQANQQVQQQAVVQAISQALQAKEADFVRQTPDYYDALAHYRQVRYEQLKVFTPNAPDEQIIGQIRAEEFNTAAALLQNGANPAEVAYRFAKTLGYSTKVKENTAQAPQPAPAGQPATTVADLDAKRRAVQGMGGNTATESTDSELERLMAAEGDEFDKAMKEMFGR